MCVSLKMLIVMCEIMSANFLILLLKYDQSMLYKDTSVFSQIRCFLKRKIRKSRRYKIIQF